MVEFAFGMQGAKFKIIGSFPTINRNQAWQGQDNIMDR
jgi:hypothetical protein